MKNKIKKVIGIDLGGRSVRAGIVDSKGQIRRKVIKEIKPSFSGEEIVNKIVKAIQELVEDDIEAIGIGCAGMLKEGQVLRSSNLPGLTGFPLKQTIEKEFSGKKVVLENDADVAGVAEWKFGAGKKGVRSLVVLTLRTGIGSGLVFEGKFIKPTEFGHIIIDSSDSAPFCGCGRQGCAERFVSTLGIRNLYFSLSNLDLRNALAEVESLKEINPEIIAKKAREGDRICQMVYERVGIYLGRLIIQIKRFCQPDIITLTGGISQA